MSRMAAKFGSGGGTSVPSVPLSATGPDSHQAPKVKGREAKKFCTRGEEYFEFLKGLGHQPSKHQQAEHFEYLFQDDASSSFVRKLMSTLKTKHCVLSGEIEKYETLQKQGLLIYGSDLEEAVSRRRTINEMYSQQKIKRLAKQEQMEKDFELQEGDLKRLGELEAAFAKQLLVWEVKEKQVAHMAELILNLIREEERDVEIDLKLLNEKMSELDKSVVQLKKDLSVHRPQRDAANYICQIEGRRLLENEERLFETIQEMIKKHGTSLIMKDAGYGIEGDTLSVENIKKVFTQFEKDFDRLKHCIIYEKVTQLSLEIEVAGQKGIDDNFEECCTKTVQLSEFDCEARRKLQQNTLEAFNNINIALQKENEDLLDHARQTTLGAVNKIFLALTNIKTRSKKKLQDFFTVATKALKAQKVRISITRNLVKAEAQLYGRLLSNIEENLAVSSRHSKKLLKPGFIETADLTPTGQILHSLLVHLGISNPLEVIASIPQILAFARKASSEFGKLYWSTIEEKQLQFRDQHKRLMKTKDVQAQMQKSSRDTPEGRNETRLKEQEENIKNLESRLKTLQQSKVSLYNELQKQSKENKQKCEEILESHQEKK